MCVRPRSPRSEHEREPHKEKLTKFQNGEALNEAFKKQIIPS